MKKILILIGFISSMLNAEYEHKVISGIVQSATTYDNKMLLVIRNYDKEFIRAEVNGINIEINDNVSGSCTTYEASTWKSCTIYPKNIHTKKNNDSISIDGKIRYISLLNEYNVLEIENNNDVLQTINIRVNKNKNFRTNENIYGNCNNKIKDEYTDCILYKRNY